MQPPPRCLLGTAVASILFLFIPASQSSAFSVAGRVWNLLLPPSGLGSTLPFAPCSPRALLSGPHHSLHSPCLTRVSLSQLAAGSPERPSDRQKVNARRWGTNVKSVPLESSLFPSFCISDTMSSAHVPTVSCPLRWKSSFLPRPR